MSLPPATLAGQWPVPMDTTSRQEACPALTSEGWGPAHWECPKPKSSSWETLTDHPCPPGIYFRSHECRFWLRPPLLHTDHDNKWSSIPEKGMCLEGQVQSHFQPRKGGAVSPWGRLGAKEEWCANTATSLCLIDLFNLSLTPRQGYYNWLKWNSVHPWSWQTYLWHF